MAFRAPITCILCHRRQPIEAKVTAWQRNSTTTTVQIVLDDKTEFAMDFSNHTHPYGLEEMIEVLANTRGMSVCPLEVGNLPDKPETGDDLVSTS